MLAKWLLRSTSCFVLKINTYSWFWNLSHPLWWKNSVRQRISRISLEFYSIIIFYANEMLDRFVIPTLLILNIYRSYNLYASRIVTSASQIWGISVTTTFYTGRKGITNQFKVPEAAITTSSFHTDFSSIPNFWNIYVVTS